MAEPKKVDLVGVGLNATDTLIPLTTCQTWGLSTRYVGKLGEDDAARLHREAFARAGVEAQLTTVPGAASPQSLILVDEGGERTVLCRRDERLLLQPDDLRREWVVNARALHVDGYETAAATQAARWARAAGIPVIADLDELYTGVEGLIENVDYLIVSRDFPCRLMADPDLESALCRMHLRFGCTLTAATLGEGGVLAWDGRQLHHRPAYRVPVVDTTGAGDIFHAGFIYGLLQGWDLERQLDFACAAAAMNCMATGARGGIQSVEAIENLMASAPRYKIVCNVRTAD
jgi:sugar/nucleoside kinase (ribokinase family)